MKLHHSRQRALLLLCLLLLPLTKVWAAGHLDSIHVLEGVVVTERFIPKDVIPAQVLGGRDLQRLSAVSVADALRYFAGVQIKDYGGIGGLKTVTYAAWVPSMWASSMMACSWAMHRTGR